jgi:hypothetical protein
MVKDMVRAKSDPFNPFTPLAVGHIAKKRRLRQGNPLPLVVCKGVGRAASQA